MRKTMVKPGEEKPIKVEVTPKGQDLKYPQMGKVTADQDSFTIKSEHGQMSFWRKDAEKLLSELSEWLGKL